MKAPVAYFSGITYVSMKNSQHKAKKFTTFWVVACLMGTFGWCVYPLITCVNCYILPFKSWYPFDVRTPFGYVTAYIFQIFGQTYVGIGNRKACKKNFLIKIKFIV